MSSKGNTPWLLTVYIITRPPFVLCRIVAQTVYLINSATKNEIVVPCPFQRIFGIIHRWTAQVRLTHFREWNFSVYRFPLQHHAPATSMPNATHIRILNLEWLKISWYLWSCYLVLERARNSSDSANWDWLGQECSVGKSKHRIVANQLPIDWLTSKSSGVTARH